MDLSSREILVQGVPLLDVRAPGEFQRGAFPTATNLPLLTDDERHNVGLEYRKRGREAAIELGHAVVSGPVKEERLAAWISFVERNPNALVCCARGGLRSEISARWLAEAGCDRPRVAGGFKALRAEAISVIAAAASDRDWLILGGRTGSAKTVLLAEVSSHLDFEGCANHRGSSFGGFATPQPSQVTFENRLATAVASGSGRLVVEDEGRNLGSLAIPEVMVTRMRASPVLLLEVPLAERVAHIANDYVGMPLEEGTQPTELRERYRESLARLKKRLGDKTWRELDSLIGEAFDGASMDTHRLWIERLLGAYYDPMYDYQISKKSSRVVFRGDREEVRNYLRDHGFAS